MVLSGGYPPGAGTFDKVFICNDVDDFALQNIPFIGVTAKILRTNELGPAGEPGLAVFCLLVLFYRIDHN